jgi:hypothetical protein
MGGYPGMPQGMPVGVQPGMGGMMPPPGMPGMGQQPGVIMPNGQCVCGAPGAPGLGRAPTQGMRGAPVMGPAKKKGSPPRLPGRRLPPRQR